MNSPIPTKMGSQTVTHGHMAKSVLKAGTWVSCNPGNQNGKTEQLSQLACTGNLQAANQSQIVQRPQSCQLLGKQHALFRHNLGNHLQTQTNIKQLRATSHWSVSYFLSICPFPLPTSFVERRCKGGTLTSRLGATWGGGHGIC